MKVRNRLLNFSDKIIYQNDDYFAFSLDSVLLANFVTIKLSDKKIVDFCCGNAPIPLFLTLKTNANITGIEIQKEEVNKNIVFFQEIVAMIIQFSAICYISYTENTFEFHN
mgnify:CR=1 FL=1